MQSHTLLEEKQKTTQEDLEELVTKLSDALTHSVRLLLSFSVDLPFYFFMHSFWMCIHRVQRRKQIFAKH